MATEGFRRSNVNDLLHQKKHAVDRPYTRLCPYFVNVKYSEFLVECRKKYQSYLQVFKAINSKWEFALLAETVHAVTFNSCERINTKEKDTQKTAVKPPTHYKSEDTIIEFETPPKM